MRRCEASLTDCRHALTLLDGRKAGAQADAWLEAEGAGRAGLVRYHPTEGA